MWERDAVLLPRTYVDIVLAAGGVPVLLPPTAEAAWAVDRVDAVLLSGGRDVAPDRYGAAPHPAAGLPHPERDTAELVVLDRALELDLPVLGVCRGAQLLNVALGGTLHQHLPDVVGHDGHNPTPGVFTDVDVRLDPAGRVGAVVGPHVRVRCHHHQAVDRLAPGLVATGWAADGTVEAGGAGRGRPGAPVRRRGPVAPGGGRGRRPVGRGPGRRRPPHVTSPPENARAGSTARGATPPAGAAPGAAAPGGRP